MEIKRNDSTSVSEILQRLRLTFPNKKKAFEQLMRQFGVEQTIAQIVSPPFMVDDLPTFDTRIYRPASPMLNERFSIAGIWKEGTDTWLAPPEMSLLMSDETILSFHESLRENWENSAPMEFPDSHLTLFGVTEGVPENLTYLVWVNDIEPEVWSYTGMNSHRFTNVASFLEAQIQH